MNTLLGNTWRRKSGLACWDFQVPDEPEHDGGMPRLYAAALLRVLELLDGFARPAEVRLTTASGGENAWVVDMTEASKANSLAEILAEVDDLEDVAISLTLLCRWSSESEETAEIPKGATIWLTLEHDAEDRLSPLRLLFSLHVDIYAAKTWGDQRDNLRLALLNAPRLEGFLKRLESDLRAELMGIDAPSYRDQVHAHGFRVP